MKSNELSFIENLAICLNTVYNAKRSIENDRIWVDDIYRLTATDILREATIFSINKSKTISPKNTGLSFRNMYYFYIDQYKHSQEPGFKREAYAQRKHKNSGMISEDEPLFDISFEELEEGDDEEWKIKEGSEAEKTISQLIHGTMDVEVGVDADDEHLKPNLKETENSNTKVHPYSDMVSKSSYNMTSKSISNA